MKELSFSIPLHQIREEFILSAGINLYVLRTDLNHPDISGNKLFKLKYNLQKARELQKKSILTFGGAYSNHIAATAAAGKEYGIKTIGIIRGEESSRSNPTLKFASDQGMELHFVSREVYRLKADPDFWAKGGFSDALFEQVPSSLIIPEGGANEDGIKGCKEIINYINIPFDIICCACGTGATLTGIILSLNEEQRAIGFQILKGENYIQQEVNRWLNKLDYRQSNWSVNEDYHFGGYAKRTSGLIRFIVEFEDRHHIPLDFIYTGKMMFGLYDLISKGYFKKGQTIIAVHTGGLQGNAGFEG